MKPKPLTAVAGIAFAAALGLFAQEPSWTLGDLGGQNVSELAPSGDPGATLEDGRWTQDGLAGQHVRFLASSGEPGTSVFAGTDSGLFRSSEGVWAKLPLAFVPSCVAVEPGNSEVVWAGVYRSPGGLYKSTDGGDHFLEIPELARYSLCPIAIDPAATSHVLVGNPTGYGFTRLSMTVDGGRFWTFHSMDRLVAEVASLLFDPDRHAIYAGTDVDSFYYFGDYGVIGSRDGGGSWQGLLPRENQGIGTILQVRALALDPGNGTIYAAALDEEGNSIFRSSDGGVTWTRAAAGLPPGASLTSLAVDPGPPAVIYTGTSGAGVFRSLDGGIHWAPLNDGLANLVVRSLSLDSASGVLRAGTEDGVFARRPRLRPSSCEPGEDRACLLGGRFQVELAALTARNRRYAEGVVVQAADRYAVFSLPAFTGDATFPEVQIKMVDPGGPPGHGFWVFHGSLTSAAYALTVTDTATGTVETFRNDVENPFCGGATVSAFVEDDDPVDLDVDPALLAAMPSHASNGSLSLLDGRFSITLSAHSVRHGRTDEGVAVQGTDRWGYFSLPGFTGDATFPEVLVKMADFRRSLGSFLLFYTGLTGLEYTVTVTDTSSGAVRTYHGSGLLCGGADALDD